jgi:hypothetical protein
MLTVPQAIVCVLVFVVVASLAWYATGRLGTSVVAGIGDGGSFNVRCANGAVDVVGAAYTPPGGAPADVTAALQRAVDAAAGGQVVVRSAALGQPAGGTLTFRYRCAALAADGFRPTPVSPCGPRPPLERARSSRGADGTTVSLPFSDVSRVSLERGALTAETAERPNVHTGVGRTALVRAMQNPYAFAVEIGLAPGQPGSLEPAGVAPAPSEPSYMDAVDDASATLLASVSRRAPPAPASRPPALVGIDSDFITDGYFGGAVLKETLTSRRGGPTNSLTATRTGLGSIRRDPRFEPGPQRRVPGGDASWSHGGNAGGPTSGGFGANRFLPGGAWDAQYVFGGGDTEGGRRMPVDAVDTAADASLGWPGQ